MARPVVWLTCEGGPSDGVRIPVASDTKEVYLRADVQSYPVIIPDEDRTVARTVRYVRDGDYLRATES